MEWLERIYSLSAELAQLVRTLFTDGMNFIALCGRSRAALAAENLFLQKQLTFYQERKIVPRRFDNVSRFMLVLISRGFAWKDALVNVTPKTLIGWHRAGFRLFWRCKCLRGEHGYHRNFAHSSEKWREPILAGARNELPMNSY